MRKYVVTGKGKVSGRPRKRKYLAASAEEAAARAIAEGTVPETVEEIPPEPPTDRQVAYAQGLGLTVPNGATKRDVSDMLDSRLSGDRPSSARHRAFARGYGLDVTDYIGKKALFRHIKAALDAPGRERELTAWFTYRVYRKFVHGAENAPIQGPNDPLIEEIAEELSVDQRVVGSIRRYYGDNLIWFGEWTAPDGGVYTGGSTRTIAYRAAASALAAKTGLPWPNNGQGRASSTMTRGRSHDGTGEGCSTTTLVVLGFIGLLIFLWVFH